MVTKELFEKGEIKGYKKLFVGMVTNITATTKDA